MHYLDNAATSFPKPPGVADEVARVIGESAGNPGRGASDAATGSRGRLEAAREVVARFVGSSDARRVAFTLNATDSLNLAIRSLARPGAVVVVSPLEHAAVLRPLRRLESEIGVELRFVEPSPIGLLDPGDVGDAARGASLVAMTCASNVLGVAQPWREVASLLRGEAIPLLLDASQAAGSLPLDADELGPHVAVALTGHKSLGGPMGAGAIVVGDALKLAPLREGGVGDAASDSSVPAPGDGMPARLEAGTLPLPAIAGLAAALEWWRATGVDVIRAREQALLRALIDGLRTIPGVSLPGLPRLDGSALAREADAAPRAPLVAFSLDGWRVDELAAVLDAEFGITVRAGLHCAPTAHRFLGTAPDGLVRASLGPTTPPEAVEALLTALGQIAGQS